MDTSTTLTTILALVLVFLFAVQKFSHQIQIVAGEKLKSILNRWTNKPLKGVVSGTFITSVVQSSTAVSVILVGLVNGGLIPSYNAVAVVIGANVGSTITAQLIAFNMTFIAPMVVIAGFILAHTHSRLSKYGKAIFYFGIIFLTLFIIENLVAPLKDNAVFITFFRSLQSPWNAIIVGAVLTAILQSSAVLTGLVLILAGSELMELPIAVGFLYGANIGSPLTAIIASTSATIEAKKVAIANALFNLIGTAIFIPLTYPFISLLKFTSSDPIQQIVNGHFIFNISCALVSLIFFKQFEYLVSKTTLALYRK